MSEPFFLGVAFRAKLFAASQDEAGRHDVGMEASVDQLFCFWFCFCL